MASLAESVDGKNAGAVLDQSRQASSSSRLMIV